MKIGLRVHSHVGNQSRRGSLLCYILQAFSWPNEIDTSEIGRNMRQGIATNCEVLRTSDPSSMLTYAYPRLVLQHLNRANLLFFTSYAALALQALCFDTNLISSLPMLHLLGKYGSPPSCFDANLLSSLPMLKALITTIVLRHQSTHSVLQNSRSAIDHTRALLQKKDSPVLKTLQL